MATGLATFDNFSWSSLLKGRQTLVVDKNGPRARRVAAALEEAGAIVTSATNQPAAADRLRDAAFDLLCVGLSGDEAVGERLHEHLGTQRRTMLILADPVRHAALRKTYPGAQIGDHSMNERSLVMFVTGTADE